MGYRDRANPPKILGHTLEPRTLREARATVRWFQGCIRKASRNHRGEDGTRKTGPHSQRMMRRRILHQWSIFTTVYAEDLGGEWTLAMDDIEETIRTWEQGWVRRAAERIGVDPDSDEAWYEYEDEQTLAGTGGGWQAKAQQWHDAREKLRVER
jgi:hypothetical protein